MLTTPIVCTIYVSLQICLASIWVLYKCGKDTYFCLVFRMGQHQSWIDLLLCLIIDVIAIAGLWLAYWLFPLKFVVETSVI